MSHPRISHEAMISCLFSKYYFQEVSKTIQSEYYTQFKRTLPSLRDIEIYLSVSSSLPNNQQILYLKLLFSVCGNIFSTLKGLCQCIQTSPQEQGGGGLKRESSTPLGLVFTSEYYIYSEIQWHQSINQESTEDYLIFIGPKGAHC